MRVTVLMIIFVAFFVAILWPGQSAALFVLGLIFLALLIVITRLYLVEANLFFLGARELRSSEEDGLSFALSHESYKLGLPRAKLYFYNGLLQRAFVVHQGKKIAIVLGHELLHGHSREELSAICFSLLLQVKKGVAQKRTKLMFLVGMTSWLVHGVVSVVAKMIPSPTFKRALRWPVNIILSPWFQFIFKVSLGEKYFRQIEKNLDQYPDEKNKLMKAGLKMSRPDEVYSYSSRKLIELSTLDKNSHFQSIIAIEFLPHEWDFILNSRMRNCV